MDIQLTEKVALVTGGASGIGRATCRRLADAGVAVAVVDIHEEGAAAVADDIARRGGRAIVLAADINHEESLRACIGATIARFDRLDIVFANAGINGVRAPIEDLTLDEWHATLDTNLTGTFLTVKHSIPHLRAAGGGSIIVTSSLNGTELFSSAGFAAYSTSKAGQVAFVRMAAFECARWNIRVNAILPGSIETNIETTTHRRNLDRIPYEVKYPAHYPPLYGRRGTADEVADLVLFLASDASRYVTGTAIPIDGALSLVRA